MCAASGVVDSAVPGNSTREREKVRAPLGGRTCAECTRGVVGASRKRRVWLGCLWVMLRQR